MQASTRQAKRVLLERAGLAGSFNARRMKGGRNNRVWRLGMNGHALLLKEYYHGPSETRDRQATEWGFLSLAWSAGLRALPRPLAAAPELHAALLGFLPGRKLRRTEAAWPHLAQAADFIAQINASRDDPGALALPPASEACLSLAEHLACLARRLQRLDAIGHPQARAFADDELVPAGKAAAGALRAWASRRGLGLNERLPPKERCLSPSDFSFQNALLDDEGKLRFLDFEYAGWDDPAKLVCDFFAQPEARVDVAHMEAFVSRALGGLFQTEPILERARACLAPHWIKWCCILLGEFLPDSAGRRAHAQGRAPDQGAYVRQLNKARAHLRRMPILNPKR